MTGRSLDGHMGSSTSFSSSGATEDCLRITTTNTNTPSMSMPPTNPTNITHEDRYVDKGIWCAKVNSKTNRAFARPDVIRDIARSCVARTQIHADAQEAQAVLAGA